MEVVCARPGVQRRVRVSLREGATIAQALEASALVEASDPVPKVGTFGYLRGLNETLRDGDRVEIYRDLIADPKAARKQRAAQHKRVRGAVRPG